jgi:hypothetical protein
MRCPKCGYISFDHLNRCNKCQTDLSGEKLRLNLLGVRPSPISLQEILYRDSQISRKKTSQERKGDSIKAQTPVVPEASALTLGEGFSLSSDDSIALDPDLITKRSKRPQQAGAEIELVLEGLEILPSPKKDV